MSWMAGDTGLEKKKKEEIPAIHIFHAQDDIAGFVLKGAIEGDDAGGVAIMADLQFAEDLFADVFFGVDANDLTGQSRDDHCASQEPEGV